jgi:two-component system response regulator HydG
MSTGKTILLVDDDIGHRTMLKANLADDYKIIEADDGDIVLSILANQHVDLMLLDLKMKRMGGIETLTALKEVGEYLPVIVITAFSSVDTAVETMKQGATDYITKPIDIEALKLTLAKVFNFTKLQQGNKQLKSRLNQQFNYGNVIGSSKAMQELFRTLSLVAPSDATVLIHGETGTGKELVANMVHENSHRKGKPFIKVNCAALHENLLESELFGHEKGAYTGAVGQRKGLFEQADSGTLFLDEIGDMSLVTQAKILRVLQEGEFERIGAEESIKVDVRILTASHKDLEEMVRNGSFRQDLFFRLNVVPVLLPPLRKRKEDIALLADHFFQKFAKKNRKTLYGIHPLALSRLAHYEWPGNIRELENTMERAVILCLGEQLTPDDLPAQFSSDSIGKSNSIPPTAGTKLRDMERELIRTTLQDTKGNKSKTAKILGVARQTLLNKIKEYEI